MNRVAWAFLLLPACSVALDFDDTAGLPCPCDEQHVCDVVADRCVLRGSVDDYKACETNTEPPGGDLLCKGTSICINVNEEGPRCLPVCRVKSYGLPEASLEIGNECRQTGTTCYETARGGVCSQGQCQSSPTACGPSAECQIFNGAGICFTVCEIYRRNEEPCGGGQVCHPIGNTNTTACIDPGPRKRNETCNLENLCERKDEFGRAMICGRAQATSNAEPRCFPICVPQDGTCNGSCTPATGGVDRITMQRVHICENEP